MFTCTERGAHIIHMYDALPEKEKIAVVAIIFFILGALSVLYFKKYKELSALQREEELREIDEEISLQLKEYEIMLSEHNRFSIQEMLEYERLLEEQELGEFNF